MDTINRQDAVAALDAVVHHLSGEIQYGDAIAAINALPAADECSYCGKTGICGWDDKPQFCGECSHGMAALTVYQAKSPALK